MGEIMWLKVLRGLAVLVALCLALASPSARAQTPASPPKATKPVASPAARPQRPTMDAMLKQTGYAYNTHNPTTWSIDLTRKNLGKVRVILSTGSDILVTFVIVAKQAQIDKTPEMMGRLLTANHDYDYTKIGFDKDGDMFVRVDMPLRTIDAKELKSIIDQVANASDEVYVKVATWINK
jgi:Putative bacterial sensory transduction regulator